MHIIYWLPIKDSNCMVGLPITSDPSDLEMSGRVNYFISLSMLDRFKNPFAAITILSDCGRRLT